jgi:hypothetical protein
VKANLERSIREYRRTATELLKESRRLSNAAKPPKRQARCIAGVEDETA